MLTTSIESLTGTSGNDTFIASQDGASATLNVADQINGGSGTDTLSVAFTADGDGTANEDIALNAASVTGIEKLAVRNVGNDIVNVAGTSFASVTEYIVDRSTGATKLNNIGTADVTIKGDGSTDLGDVTITVGAAPVTDAFVLNVDGGVKDGTASNFYVDDTDADWTSVTINSTGARNTLDDVNLSGEQATAATHTVKTLTVNAAAGLAITTLTGFAADAKIVVAGAAADAAASSTAAAAPAVKLGTQQVNVDEIDASGLTAGGVEIILEGTDTNTKFTGGKGNDKVTTGISLVKADTAVINAGDGTDTLVIANSAHLSEADEGAKYTNFEILQVENAVSVDMDHISGITGVIVNDGAGATAVADMSATQAANVTVVAYNGATTLGVKDAATVGQLDTVALTFSDGDTTTNESLKTTNAFLPTLADIETLKITAVDAAEVTLSNATAGDLSKVEIMGAGDTTLITGNIATINFMIDGSTGTGKQFIDASTFATNGVAIKTGSGTNEVTGSAQADAITLGSGKNTLMTLVGGDTVTGFVGGSGGDVIDYSGTGLAQAFNAIVADTDGTLKVIAENSTAAQVFADGDVVAISVAKAADYDTKAEIATLFGAGAEFEAVSQDDEVLLLIAAADTGKVYAYTLIEENSNTSLADAGDTVTLVGTFNGVSAAQLGDWVTANFTA